MRLNFKTKLAYGFIGIGDGAGYSITGTYLLFFLTTVAGVSPGAAGAIAALGGIWDAFCGPLVGYVSDHTQSKYGRRKPFIMAAAFPLGVATCLLFTAIDAGYGFKVFYYGVMTLLFWSSFAGFFVPYLSWGAELTQDYNERTTLRAFASIAQQVGLILGMVLPTMIVDFLISLGKGEEQGWFAVGLIVGLCIALSLFGAAWMITDKEEEERRRIGKNDLPEKERLRLSNIADMFRGFAEVLKLRSIRLIIGSSIVYLIGYSMHVSDRMYFYTYNMKMGADQISFMLMMVAVAGIFFAPLILRLSRYFDKRTVFIAFMMISILSQVGFRIAGISSIVALMIFTILFVAGSAAYWQLMPSMLYDVCEVDELATGKKRAGSVVSLQALSESVSQALGIQILGVILEFAGFDGEASVQAPAAELWVENTLMILPSVMMLGAAVLVYRYPITKAKYAQVVAALADREKGIEPDRELFRELI